jgi:NAD(P)-dependent dehydrogenase (short-subunit alcohol dehydrogenase family)
MEKTAVTTDFAGKTALVTGAGRGLGRAVALGLAQAGASLVLLARSAEQLAETQDMLLVQGAAPDRIRVIPADLGDCGERGRAAAAALAPGRIDILVNNAATVEPLGPSASIPAAQLRGAYELNVIAPAALAAAVLPGMLEARWGRIVNISSAVAARPAGMIRGNAYAATKAALEAHTVNLAAELLGTGVTVNVYRPGSVDTAMQAWIRQQDPGRIGTALHERFNGNFAQGSLITPEQSAAVLLAQMAGDTTGAIWDVSDAVAGA